MENKIPLRIENQSNLFIGGAVKPFEIGGVDLQTAVDQEGFPCIPASSFKGALRNIVREFQNDLADKIVQSYLTYFETQREINKEQLRLFSLEPEALERMEKSYEQLYANPSAEYLFGVEGFNNTPRLIFNDLLLQEALRQKDRVFSIDMKNSIEVGGNEVVSNPRTYKAARSGLIFEGEILLYKIELLGGDAARQCKDYISECLLQFNGGVHRLGNSKSRGYGKVHVSLLSESGAGK